MDAPQIMCGASFVYKGMILCYNHGNNSTQGEIYVFKKLLAILLTCLMLIPCGVAMVGEAETLTSWDYRYTLNDDGSATITKYFGEDEELTVPAELDGHPVTSIGDWAFDGCDSLTSITLPDGVISIGANPFASCEQLTRITVSPDHPTLATIDGVLFEKPTRTLICYPCAFTVESYAVPQGIQAIGDYAFWGCSALTNLSLPDGITSIGNAAFSYCASLTSITLPDSLTSIGDWAFSDCSSLTSIALPDGLTSIGEAAFCGCSSLTDFTLPDSLTSIGGFAFAICSSLTNLTLPDSMTSIGEAAFSGCSSLTDFSLPDGITSIGKAAFSGCSSLTSIALPDGITSIGEAAFTRCSSLTDLTLPDGITSIGKDAFAECPKLTLTVSRDSCALAYAKENGIPYIYPDSMDWLNG